MNFDFIPFGNAYVKINECEGDQGFECWLKHCGPSASSPADDCYTGENVCQHGPEECYGNLAEVCVKDMLNDDPSKYMPFVYCLEANGKVSTSQMEKCATISGLNPSDVTACMNDKKGRTLTAVAAKKTALVPGRDYVPYLVVNGKVLKETDLLKETVCRDYNGTKPKGCKL